ncbi:hypothetical protein GWI33_013267 [Rhynchophorus ferrugineus]|uniref:Prokaryotic-type class I peptide chain release factors domain-containing protein n=1 Tax=Rhynchophorus ferrugineus TaxID=354439 RepID=A0A834IHC3_RHYFE|nr:hypothetical protein GWI33_013267 [Rhynchophorus ferrugineus]
MYLIRKISNSCNTKIPLSLEKIINFRTATRFRLNFSQAPNCVTTLIVNNVNLDRYLLQLNDEYNNLLKNENYVANRRYIELKPIIDLLEEKKSILDNIDSLKELLQSDDKDVSDLAKEEKHEFEIRLNELDEYLIEALYPNEKQDFCDSMVLEVQAGVGGQEAMLFAQELFNTYCNFIANKGWEYEFVEYLTTEIGGLRRASILVTGPEVFKYFKHEAGVHRVQRTPITEKSGRIHTSTVSVIALPQPTEIEIHIEPKDLKIETKRSTGAGGQHVNTTDSAVRIVHIPTGISVECQIDRSQIKNRKLALSRLRAILYQRKLDEQLAETAAKRKSQVKSRDRNEKIRTYNYNQDRITDHRLNGVHLHNLPQFLEGGDQLENLIQSIHKQSKINDLLQLVENIK